jgi:hypothetical protein
MAATGWPVATEDRDGDGRGCRRLVCHVLEVSSVVEEEVVRGRRRKTEHG